MESLSKVRRHIGENNHLIQGWIWLSLGIPTLLWWKDSILWVAMMSIYANTEASFSAHAAKKDNVCSSACCQKDDE